MAIATFNGVVIQVHKKSNDDSSDYHARLFSDHKAMTSFILEYREGNFELVEGKANDKEKELMIRAIQALELSDAFL